MPQYISPSREKEVEVRIRDQLCLFEGSLFSQRPSAVFSFAIVFRETFLLVLVTSGTFEVEFRHRACPGIATWAGSHQ